MYFATEWKFRCARILRKWGVKRLMARSWVDCLSYIKLSSVMERTNLQTNRMRSVVRSYPLCCSSDDFLSCDMWYVRLLMCCTVHGEAETMGILIVSLAILLSNVIGSVPVSAENAVSCGKQRYHFHCNQKDLPLSTQTNVSHKEFNLPKQIFYHILS
jgi:hypothetical protein